MDLHMVISAALLGGLVQAEGYIIFCFGDFSLFVYCLIFGPLTDGLVSHFHSVQSY